MSNRLPTMAALDRLGAYNRSSVLYAFARDILVEIDGLNEGWIRASGMSRERAVENARRRLRRVYKAADFFKHDISQHDTTKPRIRVKAISERVEVAA